MRVTIRQKDITITPALRTYIEVKILKPVQKLLKGVVAEELPILDLQFARSTKHHHKGKIYHVSVSLSLGKYLLRAEADEEDMHTACDLIEEELESEIKTFKERARAIERRAGRSAKNELRLNKAARLYRKGRIRNEGNEEKII